MKRGAIVVLLAAVLGGEAVACSCAPPRGSEQEQIAQAYAQSDSVTLAKIEAVTQFPVAENPNYLVEEVTFRIVEVLKGHHIVGSTVHTRSVLGGACGKPAKNNPPWITEMNERGEESAVVFSEEWLIYASGSEPYELSLCSRSGPLNLRGRDVKYLRKQLQRGHKNGI